MWPDLCLLAPIGYRHRMHIDEKQKFPKCKQQKWWWENWIFEHYIWLKRSKILANQLFFSFFYIKSAVRFLIAWSWIHPGRNPMLDTCPPRQCLTRSIFEIDPCYGYEFNLSHSKSFDFLGPIYDWNIFDTPLPLVEAEPLVF